MAKTSADTSATRKQFADNLSDLIEESGKKIKEISDATGIPTGSLSQYQNDSAEAGIDKLAKLAEYFHVSTDWLLGRTDVRSPDVKLQAAVKYTRLSEKAVEQLHKLGTSGPAAKGYRLAITDMLSELIESDRFYDIFSNMGFYFIYSGVLPEDAYTSDVDELTTEEWKKFHAWANAHGQEILPRKAIKDYYLQRAADAFKKACEDIAAKEAPDNG